jgi:tol-pal system protein YbgF
MKARSLLFLPMILLSACATQKDLSYVQGQVSQLKDESQVIKQQSAGSYSEITQYREEVASLHGKIDELRHDYQGSVRRLDMEDSLMVRKTGDFESRIARIEQYLGLDNAGSGNSQVSKVAPPLPDSSTPPSGSDTVTDQTKGQPPVKTPGASSPVPPPSALEADDALLNEGLVKMKKADYSGARANFMAFMTGNPKSPKVADAQFYIAETYFSEKWYEKAILEYQAVIARYTKSPKRPASLYKQGLSFEKIGDKVNAKARYNDVVNLYPKSPEAKLAQKNLGMK